MGKRNSANNNLLRTYKDKTSPKVYAILVKLVNEDKENLAEDVLKVDYLITYANTSIKAKDFREAREVLARVEERLKKLDDNEVDISHLEYLYNNLKKQCK
ncbi:hypothetical protein [Clostridium fallax]|uniref:Uncharacterized protein n=1 Tax=Clostridium fallax TaxID=1533 RepID=A0A1M4T5J8_9CLOT|nr:hypothetical protein [Clostridium fallax]SHE39654.1 hypothetical protein SAMN05443638_10223 [Clostridium fallax]SQB22604.1 Uncharacterised protein [Clostridium fallax]